MNGVDHTLTKKVTKLLQMCTVGVKDVCVKELELERDIKLEKCFEYSYARGSYLLHGLLHVTDFID